MNSTAFASLSLKPELSTNLIELGFAEMTPVQAASLPLILAGKDLIAQAQTGSGKTAAFGLGLLSSLNVERFRVQSLVLCPTRELADQVAREIRRLARGIHNIKILTLCGGQPFGPQLGSLEHGAHIVVGTPGRIDEHIRKGSLNTEEITTLVLDEADRMLDMGFQEAMDAIVDSLAARKQTLLFSATYPEGIQAIGKRIMSAPELVQIESTHTESSISERLYRVAGSEESKANAVRALLENMRPERTLIFCNTKIETQALADALLAKGYDALAIHGDLEQRDRDQTLVKFSNRSISILVATDVAARGLDIEGLELVINYDIARDHEVHTHRIGRTGRAGESGMAVTLFAAAEQYRIDRLEAFLERKIALMTELAAPPSRAGMAPAPMRTVQIDAGRKQKVRPGDILGALTGTGGLDGKQVGKIQIHDRFAYVAIGREVVQTALQRLNSDPLKGKSVRARVV